MFYALFIVNLHQQINSLAVSLFLLKSGIYFSYLDSFLQCQMLSVELQAKRRSQELRTRAG